MESRGLNMWDDTRLGVANTDNLCMSNQTNTSLKRFQGGT
jgi:hypothetical protein